MTELTPKKVFEELLDTAHFCKYLHATRGGPPKPGALIERLSPEKRKALEGFNSDMAREYRYEGW